MWFFGRQVLPIIRSQRQLGYLDGSIPSPPRMIEEVSTRKEETTTKTFVKNPAYKDWICTASPPPVGYNIGNESQLALLDPLTYDRRISKSLIPSDETANQNLVMTVPLTGNSFQADREEKEEIAKNHLARSELPDRSVQLGKPLKPDHSKQHRRTEGLVPMMPSSKNTRMGETHRKKDPSTRQGRSPIRGPSLE